MTNKSIIKNSIFTLVTILAFFCFGSVKAYDRCESLVELSLNPDDTYRCEFDPKDEGGDCTSSNSSVVEAKIDVSASNSTSGFVCEIYSKGSNGSASVNFYGGPNHKNYLFSKNVNIKGKSSSTPSKPITKDTKRAEEGLGNSNPSLGDSNDTITQPKSGVTMPGGGTISGTACELFNVSFDRNVSTETALSGKKVGPYIANQGNIMYKVAGAGANCGGSYTAFCLDPNFDGVRRGQTLQYKAERVNPTSTFGLRMYALYLISKERGANFSDPATYFAYEIAARLLTFEKGSDYQSRSNTAKARFNSHLGPYKAGVSANGAAIGTAGPQGVSLAQAALAKANDQSFSQSAQNSTLGLRLTQIGGFNYNGSGYETHVNVTVENCQNPNCVSDTGSEISLSPGGTLEGKGLYDEKTKTKTFTYVIGGFGNPSDSCVSQAIEAKLSYSGASDIRNALQISPVDKINDDRQNYVVFSDAAGVVTNSLTISSCPEEPPGDGCEMDAVLACDQDDRNFVVVNEGSKGDGATDWEGCIIGKTDTQGNSYDVVNTTKLKQTKNEGGRTDAIQGWTSDGQEIKDSDFCVVSCKEKYAFILPGNKQNVKQGTYFSFKVDGTYPPNHAVVGISAERLCVSSSVKNGNFNKRVLDLRKQQVDFYNMYLYYKQLYNAMYSKQSMDKYKSTRTAPTCGNGQESEYICDVTREPSCSDMLARDKYRDNKWVPSWSGGGLTVEVKYCKLNNPDDLKSDINCNYTKTVPINASFEKGLGATVLQIPNKSFAFYNSKYGDHNAAWTTVMEVAMYGKTEDSEIPYEHAGGTKITTTTNPDGTSSETCEDKKSEKPNYKITYLPDSRNHESEWQSSYEPGAFPYKKYKETMDRLKAAYNKAKAKYDALNAQIGIQSDAMQECTNYLEGFGEDNNPYKYNPQITFSYPDEKNYMDMLKPNLLENMHDGEIKVNYEKFFCQDDPGSPEGVFGCGDQSGTTRTKFEFGDLYSDPASGLIDSVDQAKQNIPKYKKDVTEYFNVARVGSRATYGRYNASGGGECNSSGRYTPGKGSEDSYCYEFYQSAKQFYVQAPDGLVSIDPSGDNKTILDTDGRVYPVSITSSEGHHPFYVSFANIGQFNESGSLGRIMGGGDGKQGTMIGETKDKEVCYYEVCRIDDPECNKEPEPGCATIIANDCNNGSITDPVRFTDDKYEKCLKKLIEHKNPETNEYDCCETAEAYKDIRNGKWNKMIPGTLWDIYKQNCDNSGNCISFTIVSSEYYSQSNLSDISAVNNNGALQVNARATSLNNLFPNNQKGINWTNKEARDVITHIESLGDGIFAQNTDYHITMDSKCADAIKKYNNIQSGSNGDYSNGGFNDYSGTIVDAQTNENPNLDKVGRNAMMSEEFKKLLESSCGTDQKNSPKLYNKDDINDESKVET